MKKRKFPLHLAALAAVVFTLAGFAAVAADEGTANNPLVSLSYLNNIFKPAILSEVDAKVSAQETRIKSDFSAALTAYQSEVEQTLSGISGGAPITGQSTATYAVVTLNGSQTLTGTVGTEIMLRIGTATCVASSSPGLIDMTDGSALNPGAALVTNHLYMTTIDPAESKPLLPSSRFWCGANIRSNKPSQRTEPIS
jgi:hypothetical protein